MGSYGGWEGFDENSDANFAGVEQFSSPCFFQHTFELCIVTLVSSVGYAKVVTTEGRKSSNSKLKIMLKQLAVRHILHVV